MEIRLAPEYTCHPIWVIGDDIYDNIDPGELPIPAGLAEQIRAWAARYEATYIPDDPVSSGFSSPVEETAFAREGRRLWHALRTSLGPEYEVTYSNVLAEWERASHDAGRE